MSSAASTAGRGVGAGKATTTASLRYAELARFVRRRATARAAVAAALLSVALPLLPLGVRASARAQPRLLPLHAAIACVTAATGYRAGMGLYSLQPRPLAALQFALMVAVGVLQMHVAARALGSALVASALPTLTLPPALSVLGAAFGAWHWWSAQRTHAYYLRLPLVPCGALLRVLDRAPSFAARALRYAAAATLVYVAAALGTGARMLRPIAPVSHFVLQAVCSACWHAALLVMSVSCSKPESFDVAPPVPASGALQWWRRRQRSDGDEHRAGRARARVAAGGERGVGAIPDEFAALAALEAPATAAATEPLLIAVLRESRRAGDRELHLMALYDAHVLASDDDERRAALFADPHGTALHALLDACVPALRLDGTRRAGHGLDGGDPDGDGDGSSDDVDDDAGGVCEDNTAPVRAKFACLTLTALACRSRREDRFGVLQKRLPEIVHELLALRRALHFRRRRRRCERGAAAALAPSTAAATRSAGATTLIAVLTVLSATVSMLRALAGPGGRARMFRRGRHSSPSPSPALQREQHWGRRRHGFQPTPSAEPPVLLPSSPLPSVSRVAARETDDLADVLATCLQRLVDEFGDVMRGWIRGAEPRWPGDARADDALRAYLAQ